MTLIIGIFFRDKNDKKEIIFASDGLAVTYKNDKEIGRDEDVGKIKKLTPKICMGYAGRNSELFDEIYDELKNKIPKKIKRELESFTARLQEIILKKLNTKKFREIEEYLKQSNQLYSKFIVGGVFSNKMYLITASPDDNYILDIKEISEIPPSYYIAGASEEIQKETWEILDEKLDCKQSTDVVENDIRDTISIIAEKYPDTINNHVFIRRLSNRFD